MVSSDCWQFSSSVNGALLGYKVFVSICEVQMSDVGKITSVYNDCLYGVAIGHFESRLLEITLNCLLWLFVVYSEGGQRRIFIKKIIINLPLVKFFKPLMPTPRNVQEISFLVKQNKNIKYKYFTLKNWQHIFYH